MKPLYIFDIDGTVTLADHRRHLIEGDNPDWNAFYDACDKDLPNPAVIKVLELLRFTSDIWFFSGRSDRVRAKTITWLEEHTSFWPHELQDTLMMRKDGDFTADDQLKSDWLRNMLQCDRDRLVASFDDRDRVVKMWRDHGVTCFQVAPGAF